jgi:dipeptide/tripeptide permease
LRFARRAASHKIVARRGPSRRTTARSTLSERDDRPRTSIRESVRILFSASRGYLLVNVANLGDGIAYFGILTLMTLFMQHNVGLSAAWSTRSIGWYTGAVTIFMALGGGAVSDRLGVRRALTLCIGVLLVGRVLLVFSPGLDGFWVAASMAWFALFLMAAGEGVIQPALYSGIKEYTDKRTETLGYAFLYSIMNLGIVIGGVLSPLIRQVWASRVEGQDVRVTPTAGIAGAFWFFIAITALMLLVNVTLFTRSVERRDRRVPAGAPVEGAPFDWRGYLRNLPILDLRFVFFIFILLPVRTLFAHQYLTMPDYVTRAFPGEIGARWEWINIINPTVIVIFVPLIAALTLRRRVVDMMIAGTSISALCTFLLVAEPNLYLLVAYMVIWSLGEAAWSSRFLEYVADIAPANRVGIYMGVAGIPWFLAKMITGSYAGNVLDAFVPLDGPQRTGTMWLLYALIALITPVGLIVARRWLIRGVRNEGVGDSGGGPDVG